MVVSLFMSMLMGCEIDFEKRTLPAPAFHAEDVYGQNRTVSQTQTESADDPFAELSATAAQPDVGTQNLKSIGFAGMVKSSLPHDVMGGGWSTASSEREFLLVHEETSSNGPVPTAIVYGYYDPQSNTSPTLTTRRFASVVDPGFEQTGFWELNAFISKVVSALSVDNPISTTELQAVLSVFQPTLGIGFGYRSFPETFTGWKWVGQNQYGIVYSLGKTNGKFVQASDDLQSKILSLRDMSSEELFENMATLTDVQQEISTVSGTPAEMILGTMTYQGQIVYISMMCLTQPTCSQEETLIDVLNHMSPLGPQDIIASSLYSSPSDLGWKYGLPLFQSPTDAFENAERMVNEELTKLESADMSSVFSSVPELSDSLEVIEGAAGNLNTTPSGFGEEAGENQGEGNANTQGQEDSGY